MKCNQENCASDATHIFTWPGRSEAPICDAHLRKARDTASTLGFFLPVKRIETPYNATASKPSVRCERCGTQLPHIEIAGVGVDRDDVEMKGATMIATLAIECPCGERCGIIISRTFTKDAKIVDVVAAFASQQAEGAT